MNLTIAELVQAVDKSENYIRQHIHRKHLTVQKDGHNVSVALDEAMRWARRRGLPFNLPTRASVTTGAMEDRIARMTVLTWHAPDAQPCNLFTLIRHRRKGKDVLGLGLASRTRLGLVSILGMNFGYFPLMRRLSSAESWSITS